MGKEAEQRPQFNALDQATNIVHRRRFFSGI
jgi:hypothetical protein